MKVYENNNKESFEFETQGRITKQRIFIYFWIHLRRGEGPRGVAKKLLD